MRHGHWLREDTGVGPVLRLPYACHALNRRSAVLRIRAELERMPDDQVRADSALIVSHLC